MEPSVPDARRSRAGLRVHPREVLPASAALAHEPFAARRRALGWVLVAHAALLVVVALLMGFDPVRALAIGIPAPVGLGAAALLMTDRRTSTLALVSGLGMCSTLLVHVTDGAPAAHAHAIAVVAAATILQEWAGIAWAFVLLWVTQGLAPVVGPILAPEMGFAPGGIARGWAWALLHPLVMPVAAAPSILTWRMLQDVQERAAELAWETERAERQADRRRAQSDLLLSLTRRNQVLLEAQLAQLDALELDEADPDALAGLFRLDHLATRMRRNMESLLVLSGDEPPHGRVEPVALSEVVRGAVGEVEQYTRVEVVLAEDPLVRGAAADDLTHLLAELIDNATSFSQRSALVVVSGQATTDGYDLRVKDRGRGMTDQALHERNRQLAQPPDLDLELTSMLGLHVCARLARRLSVDVALERNGTEGISAAVRIPAALLSEQVVMARPLLAAALAALGGDEDEMPDELGYAPAALRMEAR